MKTMVDSMMEVFREERRKERVPTCPYCDHQSRDYELFPDPSYNDEKEMTCEECSKDFIASASVKYQTRPKED